MPALEQYINDPANRVAQAIFLYAEQETQLLISNPAAPYNEPREIALKLDYYTNIYRAYRKTPNTAERQTLRYLRREIAKLKARQHPTLLNRLLFNPLPERIRNFITGDTRSFRWHQQGIKTIQKEKIREHNLHTLSESMKKAGFKFEIEGTLKRMIDLDLPQFHVRYADVHHRNADFVLHFKKLPGSDVYYFEKFDTTARPNLDAVLKNDASGLRQTFSPNGEVSFTAREAHSLVTGKSICKDVNGKETWLVLDHAGINQPGSFRQVSFDLQKALKKLPIKNLDNPAQYNAIANALKKGLTKEVTLQVNGQESKYHLAAAPTRKTIDVLDKDDRLVDLARLPGSYLSETTKKLAAKISQEEGVIQLPTVRQQTGRKM